MYCVGRALGDRSSILLDYIASDYDPRYLGSKSEPYTMRVDDSAVAKVAYASHCAAPWAMPEAPPPFFWHLINNTPTYRAYEEFLQSRMKPNTGTLHTGDDYFCHHPIRPGDFITTTCEITRQFEKPGRQGRMKFLEDEWMFRNQDNVLVGSLVRKAVGIYYSGNGTKGRVEEFSDADTLAGVRTVRLDRDMWKTPQTVDVFDGQPAAYVHDIGPVDLEMNIRWMGAVDDYSRNHYDSDYARERGFEGGLPVLAGPHMAALMMAPVMAFAGAGAEIAQFRHIQRRSIHPGERLRTVGFTEPDLATGNARVKCWLLDDQDGIRHWGEILLRRRQAPRGGTPSAAWMPARAA